MKETYSHLYYRISYLDTFTFLALALLLELIYIAVNKTT